MWSLFQLIIIYLVVWCYGRENDSLQTLQLIWYIYSVGCWCVNMGLWKYIHLVLTKVINACDSLIYIYSVHVLLVFLKTSPVPTNDNLPRSMVFVVDIWPSSRHSNTVGICGQLIIMGAWKYIHPFLPQVRDINEDIKEKTSVYVLPGDCGGIPSFSQL